jgi:tetratricopeptide (TPR) repeat protein
MIQRIVISLLVLAGASSVRADERPHSSVLCQGSTNAQVTAARSALNAAPESLPARFKLADVLVEANCYDEAVHTLEDGEALHPRSNELQAKLRTTRSLASEQVYFEGKEQAEQAARVSRNLLRCNRLGDLNACDEALKLKPDDADILVAKGDALLKASKLAEAEQAYRRARQVAPDHPRAASKLAAAQSQRQAAQNTCLRGTGDGALEACLSALLPGAEEEFAIQSRMGSLYQQRNQAAPALAAFIAANTLKPGDRGVASGIVSLTDAGSGNDAVALAARGSALLTLDRGKDALAALRQAQTLAPAMPDLRNLIAQAQKMSADQGATAPAPVAAAAATPAATLSAPPVKPAARVYSNTTEPTRSY